MSTLTGKKILFCRSEESSGHFAALFRKSGIQVDFFPTFQIDFSFPAARENARTFLPRITEADWILFTSSNGVAAFFYHAAASAINVTRLKEVKIGVVGIRSAETLRNHVADLDIQISAANLNTLLRKVSDFSVRRPINVLHFTSVQSIAKIKVDTLDAIKLNRIPLYRAIKADHEMMSQFRQLGSENYDVIFFGSPSSFEYFLEMPGSIDLLSSTVIAAFGNTTGESIKEHGFTVDIIPENTTPESFLKSMTDFFMTEIYQ